MRLRPIRIQPAQLLPDQASGLPPRPPQRHFDAEAVHAHGVREGGSFVGGVAGFTQLADLGAAFWVDGERGRGDGVGDGFGGDEGAVEGVEGGEFVMQGAGGGGRGGEGFGGGVEVEGEVGVGFHWEGCGEDCQGWDGVCGFAVVFVVWSWG